MTQDKPTTTTLPFKYLNDHLSELSNEVLCDHRPQGGLEIRELKVKSSKKVRFY